MPPRYHSSRHVCGCYVYHSEISERTYLPQVKLDAHTTILSTAARTVLTQTFVNRSREALNEIRYAFPLFDGVSVVEFFCQIGERTIYGLVKEKNEARKTYEEAKERGESAALLEQLPDAADVFTTAISNIPNGASVQVSVKYVQELKHDAEVDGIRLTIPSSISPRYGYYPGKLQETSAEIDSKGISITVDVNMAQGIPIKKVISPSHPIEVTLGSLSTSASDEDASISRGSATLALGTTELEKDFVLQVVAKDVGIPQAILETHPTLPNQRALMTTLVPKFNIKSQKPEVVFIADRSGSMEGHIPTLKSALKVFLKSISIGCSFNICSFGSSHSFLWPESRMYDQDTLTEAIRHVETFRADFGGTETLAAVKACFEARNTGLQTELMLLTDGDIWSQEQLFNYVSKNTKSGDVRVFPIGIGSGVSSALIEGVARAGRGFAQMVADSEKLDSKIVRMLKGALTPHIKDYRLEVKYEDGSVESVADSLRVKLSIAEEPESKATVSEAKPISLYDPDVQEEHPKDGEPKNIFAGLPELKRPTLLQTPHEIPSLFPFNRTCVYLIMSPESSHLQPKSVVLRGTSPQGPLELEIPVEVRKDADQMIHQLAARKATQELEEGHGWLSEATVDDAGVLVKDKHRTQFPLLQRREAVRLGVEYQVGGKHCSFVAVEANEAEIAEKRKRVLEATLNRDDKNNDNDWEVLEDASDSSDGEPVQGGAKQLASIQAYSMPVSASASARTGGVRRQLASKAAPSSGGFTAYGGSPFGAPEEFGARSSASQSSTGFFGVASRGGRGLGRGGAMRHRKVAPQATNDCHDLSLDMEEKEESDEDMGFALMDSPVSPQSPAYSPTSPSSPNSKRQKTEEETGTLLQRLIARQSFEGSWAAIDKLPCDEMKLDRDAASKAIAKLTETNADKVLATATAVMFLEKKMQDEEETWELVVEKARAWLENELAEDVLAQVWQLAEGIVGKN
ncbi:von Willebrand domain-containing protein [Alternaria alternata]|nr:von Willebrand domain-containing protein [Alternaria alternata]